jgi:hypothetical protein
MHCLDQCHTSIPAGGHAVQSACRVTQYRTPQAGQIGEELFLEDRRKRAFQIRKFREIELVPVDDRIRVGQSKKTDRFPCNAGFPPKESPGRYPGNQYSKFSPILGIGLMNSIPIYTRLRGIGQSQAPPSIPTESILGYSSQDVQITFTNKCPLPLKFPVGTLAARVIEKPESNLFSPF